MGDRCFVNVCIAERDLAKFQAHNFQAIDIPDRDEWGEERWPGVISLDIEEVNYAGDSDWETAAAAGLRFLVGHGPGSGYGPGMYASDGERAHFIACTWDGEPMVPFEWEGEFKPLSESLEAARKAWKAWKEFLEHAKEGAPSE